MNLDKILEFDAIDAAEKMGLSAGACLLLSMSHNLQKGQVLEGLGDTHFAMSLDKYIEVIESAGFVLAKRFEFERDDYYIYWKDGLLLAFDSYGRKSVNGGNIYYNWRRNDDVSLTETFRLMSSGCWSEDRKVWVGDHDCREALLFNMNRLVLRGKFLPKWQYKPSLWLIHYEEYPPQDMQWQERHEILQECTRKKLLALPAHLQEYLAIAIKESNDYLS